MADKNPFADFVISDAEAALNRVLPEALALPDEQLKPVNIDVPTTLITAFAVTRRLPAYEHDLRQLYQFPVEAALRFPDYALALFCAQAHYVSALRPKTTIHELVAQCNHWRNVLEADAQSLILRGLLHFDLRILVSRTKGWQSLAFDLAGFHSLYQTAWPTIQGKTGLQWSDVEEAKRMSWQLTEALSERERVPKHGAAVTEQRLRVFARFISVYDQLRRAFIYLRWEEGDADKIIPSLYNGRRTQTLNKRRKDTAKAARAQATVAPNVAPEGSSIPGRSLETP